MKTLYLLRHAKSSWANAHLDDHDRPLNDRGRAAAALVAQHVARAKIAPDLILCSTACRAQETLEPMRAVLDPATEIRIDGDLYGAPVELLKGQVAALPDTCASVMIIGHNPGLSELAVDLLGATEDGHGAPSELTTAALATLTVDEPTWSLVRPGSAALTALVLARALPGAT